MFFFGFKSLVDEYYFVCFVFTTWNNIKKIFNSIKYNSFILLNNNGLIIIQYLQEKTMFLVFNAMSISLAR